MPTTSNASTIEALFNAFNERDFDHAAALVTEDFELVDYAFGLAFHGPTGLLQWFQGFVTAGPDARAHLIRTIVEGEWIASEHVGRFTQTGPLVTPAGEIPPTGRKVEIQFAEIYQVKGDKIALLHAYYDGATIMRQLGLMS
ncbi:MAG TPA: nuclear transport factor 2 family protein [Ktedonobacteraceae bacterium]